MSDNGTEISMPMGRIVWGHPLEPQDKTKDNVKVLGQDGQPVKQWSFGLAVPKAEFTQYVWPAMLAEAAKGYSSGVPNGFSYKIKDGDDTSPVWVNGQERPPYASREGYPGNWIVTLSTEFQAPSLLKYENGAYHQLQAGAVKTGDYVMVGANLKWHAGQSPGLYVNPLTVLLCYEGDALGGSYTADPTQVYGQAPQMAAMPAGARPIGAAAPMQQPPAGAGLPGMQPGVGVPMQPQQPMMQPQTQQPMQPQQPMMQPQTQQPMMQQPGQQMPPQTQQPMMQQPGQQMPPPATDFIPQQPMQPQAQQPMMQPGQPAMQPQAQQPMMQPGQPQYAQPGQMPGNPPGR